ncbi:hypothetical protein VCV18_008987 [Metarhizium anisopliae]
MPWSTKAAWASALSIYRHNATLAADRYTSSISQVKDLTAPLPQDIKPIDLFTALETLICPYNSQSSNCGVNTNFAMAANAMFTDSIWASLLVASNTPTSTVPLDLLRNMMATVLFIYNPVFAPAARGGPSISTVQPNLPQENYFQGSFAERIDYIAPEPWTVYAYLGVGAFLILAAVLAISVASRHKSYQESSFDFVNLLRLRVEDGQEDLRDVFGTDEDDKSVLVTAQGIRVGLKQGMEGNDAKG